MSARTLSPRVRPQGLAVTPPQVNLLPPEIHSKRGLVRVKRWLVFAVIIALALFGGVVALAMLTENAADAELAQQVNERERLLAEQQRYAEVPLVLGQLDRIQEARLLGMATDVVWPDYVLAIAATAPAGVSIENLKVAAVTPMAPTPTTASPLADPSIANVTFTANSLTLPDTATWLEGLESVTGLADAWFSDAAVTELPGGVAGYTVSASVQVDTKAFSNRFLVTEEES